MKKSVLLVGLALMLLLGACSATAPNATYAEPVKISTEEAHVQMSEAPVVVVDARTAEEYAQNHIPGAILLPEAEIGTSPLAALPVPNACILLYGQDEAQSAQAAEKLAEAGYVKVSDFGGIDGWTYETEAGAYTVPAKKEGTLTSFMAYDLDGMPVDETVFANHKLTMINIWATFCGPCLDEMPELGQLAAEYAPRGVQIIGIAADVKQNADGTFPLDMLETAQELVVETKADYMHLLPTGDLVSAKIKNVNAVPETIFVDSEGNLVGESYLGSRSGEAWVLILDELLATVE